MQTQSKPRKTTTSRRRRNRVLIGAAGLAVVVIAGAAISLASGNGDELATAIPVITAAPPTTVATTVAEATTAVPTPEAGPDYSLAQETLDTWAAAIGAADVDAAMATHMPDDESADREAMWYIAATASHAEFNDCQFSTTSGRIQARCDLTLTDPILAATQRETVPVSWQLTEDGAAILVSAPGDRLSPKNLFVSYAQEHYPDTFAAACGQGTVNYNSIVGWAFNRACGEFTAEIANEVADAIREAG